MTGSCKIKLIKIPQTVVCKRNLMIILKVLLFVDVFVVVLILFLVQFLFSFVLFYENT